jgi:hypothetical protein
MSALIAPISAVEFGASRATQTGNIFHDYDPVRQRHANAVKLSLAML